jgi:protein phosphatase
LSDVGCCREVNEDRGCLTHDEKGALLLVADGMGGHAAGEVASSLAITAISRVYGKADAGTEQALETAFHAANREIYQAAAKNKSLRGMGTTCTALAIRDGLAYSAHVGDSRLYLVRGGQIYLMSEDHSAVMEMVRRGLITRESARHHEDKNVILRALGTQPKVEVSVWDKPFPVQTGDQFVLCSDGLYDLIEDEELQQAVWQVAPKEACISLIKLALQRGGPDNITVGVLQVVAKDLFTIRTLQPTRELSVVS